MKMYSLHGHDNNDNCDICGKSTPYYMLTNFNGDAVCSHCLSDLSHEYEYYIDDDLEE